MELPKRHKSDTISRWRCNNVIYHNFDELYEVYIKTMNCQHCGKEFPNTKDRHLDHDHETGMFRKIVCNGCNNNDRYINYPNGYDKKKAKQINYEKHKHKHKDKLQKYRDDHKEKNNNYAREYRKKNMNTILEKQKEKMTCECGSTFRRSDKSDHNRTLKHTYWWFNSLD
tara:strand:+ start:39 stop:548 length:510 start_codon:yes stop_codon:yes gene_type:complete